MAENTKIEWATHTFNPWTGCQAVSPGCDHCYADRQVSRFRDFADRKRTAEANWRKPITWNGKADKMASERGLYRQRVFCASFADVFDNKVPQEWRTDLWRLIGQTPHLDWLLLTKRPQNVADMAPVIWRAGWPDNIWLGTTVENQTEADRRIPILLEIPASVHFLSCEPLLGPVDIARWLHDSDCKLFDGFGTDCTCCEPREQHVGWVICGGESGPRSRPMHPAWALSLRNQCGAAGVPFFFKQWGDWTPGENATDVNKGIVSVAHWFDGDGWHFGRENMARDDGHVDDQPDVYRIGKSRAGRLLDGRTWDELPNAGQ